MRTGREKLFDTYGVHRGRRMRCQPGRIAATRAMPGDVDEIFDAKPQTRQRPVTGRRQRELLNERATFFAADYFHCRGYITSRQSGPQRHKGRDDSSNVAELKESQEVIRSTGVLGIGYDLQFNSLCPSCLYGYLNICLARSTLRHGFVRGAVGVRRSGRPASTSCGTPSAIAILPFTITQRTPADVSNGFS